MRVLEYDLHVSAHTTKRLAGLGRQIPALKHDASGRGLDQSHDETCDSRLA